MIFLACRGRRHWRHGRVHAPLRLSGVPALELRLIEPDERRRFDQELCEKHYLRNATLVGQVMRYVAVAPDGRWLALLAWSSAALHLRPRDRWIGWSEAQRAARLGLVARNSRFLVLAERAHYPNLASHLLALCARRLPGDWLAAHGHTVLVAETFVDPEQYQGTCYRAAGWTPLGPTGGFARGHRDYYVDLEHPKQLWVRALHPQARAWLRAEALPPALAAHVPEPAARSPCTCEKLGSLWQSFHDRLTDPRARRGKRHLLATILTIAAVATICGERGPKGFAEFAALLSQPQRRRLRCAPHKQTGRLVVPSEPTFRRAFRRIDRAPFHDVLAAWMAEHDPQKLTAVAVDGKTVKGSRQSDRRPVHLLSAVAHHSERLLNPIPIAEKSNEIPAFDPLLEPLPLAGTLVTADAEHCQRAHARFLVYQKGADYLFLAKGNQPTLEALAQSKLPGGLPPRN